MTDEELGELLAVVHRSERERTTLEERVELLETRRAITDLVMRYGWLCDARRWDELLDCFTDDIERVLLGTLDERVQGKARLRELYKQPKLPRKEGVGGSPPTAAQINQYELRHLIHPPVVRVSDDGVTATAATVYSLVATAGEASDFRRGVHEGAYIFDFRREPGPAWCISRMVVITENARNPLFS